MDELGVHERRGREQCPRMAYYKVKHKARGLWTSDLAPEH